MMGTEGGDFSLVPMAGAIPRSRLRWRGRVTGAVLDGIELAAQYPLAVGHLLFLTEDSPFEEALHIYLIGPDLRVLDGLELGAPYTPAILEDLRREGDDRFSFSFFGQDRWQLRVAHSPQWCWDLGLGAPVRRKGGVGIGRRWLALRPA